MSWLEFGLSVAALVAVLLILIALPWFRRGAEQENVSSANVSVVKQRLAELEREVSEGLLAEQDMRQASDEIKVALVDEAQEENRTVTSGGLVLLLGALVALGVGGWAYSQANNLDRLQATQEAIDALPDLSTKLAQGNGENFTPKDFQQLTLAIRKRLQMEPEDGQGWMYLGRIWMALDQQDQAFAAYEKAIHYAPGDSNVRTNYARALMASDDKGRLQSARQLLSSLLQDEPDNSNLVLMLAVVAGRLGDEAVLASNLSKLDGLLPADNPLMVQLQSRLTQLRGETPESASEAQQLTGFNIEISISDELAAKLPENGFLFVFAQDANSDNRMPAAVLRMPLSTLPATVTLTQENAMTPNYSLAQLSEVKLMARVSADQEAPAVTGDLEGVMNSEVVQGNILDATIVINKEIM